MQIVSAGIYGCFRFMGYTASHDGIFKMIIGCNGSDVDSQEESVAHWYRCDLGYFPQWATGIQSGLPWQEANVLTSNHYTHDFLLLGLHTLYLTQDRLKSGLQYVSF